MGLFNKKKAEKNCCCGSSCTPEKMEQAETVKTAAGVKVLGSGCAKCHALEDAAKAAAIKLSEEEIAMIEKLGGEAQVNVIRYWEKEMK